MLNPWPWSVVEVLPLSSLVFKNIFHHYCDFNIKMLGAVLFSEPAGELILSL